MSRLVFITVAINLLLPGAGVILARRHWLGTFMVLLHTATGHYLIWNILVTPQSSDTTFLIVSLLCLTGNWLSAQWVLARQLRRLADPSVADQISTCISLTNAAVSEGRLDDAYGALNVAITVDDENLECYVRLARLCMLLGKYQQARRTWLHVEALDKAKQYRREMIQAIERMPDRLGR